jgi:hypothetical protein
MRNAFLGGVDTQEKHRPEQRFMFLVQNYKMLNLSKLALRPRVSHRTGAGVLRRAA